MKRFIAIVLTLLIFASVAYAADKQYVAFTLAYSATRDITSTVRGDALYYMTATGNCALTMTGGVRGDSTTFFFLCDSAARVMTFGTGFTSGGTFTLTANLVNVIRFTYTGSTWKEEYRMYGNASGGGPGGGMPGGAQGDILYTSATDTWSNLVKSTTATRYLSNTGTNNNPAWAQVALGTGVSGTLPIANGGTGAATKAPAFDALSPITALGDIIYGGASGVGTQLAGNITTTTKYLQQIGTGAVSAAPSWNQVSLTAGVTGILPTANGGSGINTTGLVVPLTYAGTIACDMSLGTVFTTTTVHATGNATINATNGTTGQKITFLITNDATTGKTITFGTNFVANGTLVGTVNLTATVVFTYNGSSWQETSRAIPTVIKNNQDVTTTGTPTFNAVQSVMFSGLYNRERADKWAIKSYTTAAQRYILQTPTNLGIYLNGKVYVVSAKTDYDLSLEATWDAVAPTDYRVGATRAGKDFYIYAVEVAGNTLRVLISANASAPSGYTTTTSRLVGGFHCLCLSVGAITGHTLTNFVTGDILPNSVWDYSFRPLCAPQGMVFSPMTNLWVDIYLASEIGALTKSVFNGVISDTRNWMDFVDDGGAVSKRMLYDPEFQIIASGINEETNIAGSADPVTTGGHVDTAGRRMIANNGCEDLCGVMWQWLIDNGYQYQGGAHTHNNTITFRNPATGSPTFKLNGETKLNAVTGSGADEVITNTSVDPAPVFAYYNLPGVKGSLYRQGTYGDVKLIAGAGWADGTDSGSRSRYMVSCRWAAVTSLGCRFASEPLNH